MLDIPDPVLDLPAGSPIARHRALAPEAPTPSPLRAWSMWGGVGSFGLACAASIAHAASRLGRVLGARSSS
jgi:hypothetical protein